jgi:hypothetical protein
LPSAIISRMTPDELTAALKIVQKTQFETMLTNLHCRERIFALEAVLGALDAKAKGMLEKQIVVERDKNQKERDSLLLAIRLLQSPPPTNTN